MVGVNQIMLFARCLFFLFVENWKYFPNYLNGIFTHLKKCLADTIHNFKWVKIIRI